MDKFEALIELLNVMSKSKDYPELADIISKVDKKIEKGLDPLVAGIIFTTYGMQKIWEHYKDDEKSKCIFEACFMTSKKEDIFK